MWQKAQEHVVAECDERRRTLGLLNSCTIRMKATAGGGRGADTSDYRMFSNWSTIIVLYFYGTVQYKTT